MNLLRPQVPYRFRPPQYSPWFKPVANLISRGYLTRKFKVKEVKISGAEKVADLARKRQPLLIAPNHADHADPSLMLTVARRYGFTFHFMAAREGFEKNALQRFFLQKSGAFSVNREGGDLGAIKTAIHILRNGEFPLVIFPEGEIYHHHEVLDELNEGVARILLRATAKLPTNRNSYVIPTGIRIRNGPDIAKTFSERLDRLESYITWKPKSGLNPVERIYRLGSALLSIKEEEFLGRARQGNLVERIQGLQTSLVESIESTYSLCNTDLSMPARIKALRAKIRKELTSQTTPLDPRREAELYDRLDRIFVAQQLYSYPGRYLKQNPTHDRIAETLFKLEEDVLNSDKYYGPRTAEIKFDAPIDVRQFLQERSLSTKSGGPALTERIGNRLQGILKEFE